MAIYEAECTRCHETFTPHGIKPEDLIHGEDRRGQDCGGIGFLMGEWLRPGEAASITKEELASVQAMEKHGWDHPMCMDPDCEFHHPEVREA